MDCVRKIRISVDCKGTVGSVRGHYLLIGFVCDDYLISDRRAMCGQLVLSICKTGIEATDKLVTSRGKEV